MFESKNIEELNESEKYILLAKEYTGIPNLKVLRDSLIKSKELNSMTMSAKGKVALDKDIATLTSLII